MTVRELFVVFNRDSFADYWIVLITFNKEEAIKAYEELNEGWIEVRDLDSKTFEWNEIQFLKGYSYDGLDRDKEVE